MFYYHPFRSYNTFPSLYPGVLSELHLVLKIDQDMNEISNLLDHVYYLNVIYIVFNIHCIKLSYLPFVSTSKGLTALQHILQFPLSCLLGGKLNDEYSRAMCIWWYTLLD